MTPFIRNMRKFARNMKRQQNLVQTLRGRLFYVICFVSYVFFHRARVKADEDWKEKYNQLSKKHDINTGRYNVHFLSHF